MQLDSTRIPIKERGYFNLLDLALAVVRRHAAGLLATSLLGAVPFALLNYWLLKDTLEAEDFFNDGETVFEYCFWLITLMIWEMPLASAPTTLFLGQALFEEQPSGARLLKDFLRAVPQLLIVQVMLRGVLVGMCITWLVLFLVWPYLNEIILLERNPLFGSRQTITTFRRCSRLHHQYGGDLFRRRWFIAVGFGGLWAGALVLAITWTGVLTQGGVLELGPDLVQIWLPVALWIVFCYFNVVRFLSYLDLRIRGEGWEIELRMRAEAQRLATQNA